MCQDEKSRVYTILKCLICSFNQLAQDQPFILFHPSSYSSPFYQNTLYFSLKNYACFIFHCQGQVNSVW